MRSTGLEMAKNQGLDSVYQNKKIKIKNFERRQRRDMLAYTGMPICSKGVRFRRPCPLPICPYLCRMEEKAKRSGREQERRPPRQAAAAAAGGSRRQDGTAAASCVRP